MRKYVSSDMCLASLKMGGSMGLMGQVSNPNIALVSTSRSLDIFYFLEFLTWEIRRLTLNKWVTNDLLFPKQRVNGS